MTVVVTYSIGTWTITVAVSPTSPEIVVILEYNSSQVLVIVVVGIGTLTDTVAVSP